MRMAFLGMLLFGSLLTGQEVMPEKLWVSHPENGSVAIQFLADAPCGGALQFRQLGKTAWQEVRHTLAGQIVRDRTLHRFRLRGEPGKWYEYRTIQIDPMTRDKETFSAIRRVQIPSAEKRSYAFSAMADFQFNTQVCQQLIGIYSRLTGMKECDFAVSLGDMSMGFDTVEEDILRKWILPVSKDFPTLPMVPVRGNHEWRGPVSSEWVRMMGEPESGQPYYAFRYGPDCFVVLDTFEDKPDRRPGNSYTDYHDSASYRKQQRVWLEKLVETPLFKDARYRIVLLHCSAYGPANGFNVQYVRDLTGGLLDRRDPQYRVHLMMGGHLHTYMRGMPGEDVLYWHVPTVGQVKSSRTSGKLFPYPVILQDGPGGACDSTASRVEVSDQGIEVRSFVKDGTVIDHVLFKPDGTAQVMVSPAGYKVKDAGCRLKDGTEICPVYR